MSRKLLLAAAATAVVVGSGIGGGAVAVAVATPAPAQLTACVQKGSNLMRLVTGAGRRCNKHETKVTWNVVGPQGDQGPQGTTGATGPAGADGADGTSVTVATEDAGTNCQYGGAAVTDATHTVYVCNGAPGAPAAP